ncbi:MAG: CaiB/BaiF CoA transferase family protein [Steroidobacteraceae bacterium]
MAPLSNVRVLEFAALGPAPFCAMMLADMGADVIRVESASASPDGPRPCDPLQRSRRSIALNLKKPAGVEIALELAAQCDILLEGFRPGVLERLGLGPHACLTRNPRLVFGRMTGWGQDGPLAHKAGHDINYIAVAGALHLIGPQGGKPLPPLNLVGDFGGGGMLLAVGVLGALLDARRSGRGQVVDASMVDGTAAMLAMFFGFRAEGYFRDATGENFLAGAAPYYDTYRTQDDRYIAIGAIEPQFYQTLLKKLGIDTGRFANAGYPNLDAQAIDSWPDLRAEITARISTRTRDEWIEIFKDIDACVAPVLSLEEAAQHPHNMARSTFIEVDGVLQNAPAPKFSDASVTPPRPPRRRGEDTDAVLAECGFTPERIKELRAAGVLT